MAQVEILLPTFQGETYLAQQLESLLQQQYRDWSLLIRDDGSTDGTLSIIQRYQEAYPDRIRLIPTLPGKQRQGAAASFGILFEHSSAPYVMCCDQDDFWKPEKISLTLQAMQSFEKACGRKTPCLIHTDLEVVKADLTPISLSFWRYSALYPKKCTTLGHLLSQNVVTGCTLMANRALLDKAAPIPAGVIMHDWWLALVAAACGVVHAVPTATMLYRQHGNNTLGAKAFNSLHLIEHIVRRVRRRRDQQGFRQDQLHREQKRKQAELLLQCLQHELSPAQKEVVQAYCSLEERGFLGSRLQILKHGLYKQGFLRNVNLFTSRKSFP